MNPANEFYKSISIILFVVMALVAMSSASNYDDLDDEGDRQIGSLEVAAPMRSSSSINLYNRVQEPRGLDSNIANARVRSNQVDLKTAAGHHYHHKHSPSGWLKMGAHTGKKGAFGWHAKYPVGGKGRR